MKCNNCGNDKAHAWRVSYGKEGRFENCDRCGTISAQGIPDVYWTGSGYHPGILDKDNKPIFLESRRHKANLMKQMGLREAGDLNGGQRGTESININRMKRESDARQKEAVRREAHNISRLLPKIDINRIPPNERNAFQRIKQRFS